MKKPFLTVMAASALGLLLTGCLNLEFGGGTTTKPQGPTVGQELIDLQRAKDSGAITEAEYQAQRTKLINSK